ncbi:MAG: HlyD family efflux transporter periplasmic adaptor subunit [Crocinitomicaceae bacterium]|nr:HlyD family efflux transporter periplasmic adaptor subunit [Crocinitomicaceae bacterium]
MKNQIICILCVILIFSCTSKNNTPDATGTFEAIETIVSAEANGVIKKLSLDEGQHLNAGDTIGYIDSLQLSLKKKQIEAQIKAILSKNPDAGKQLAALREQSVQAKREEQRIANLVKAGAAPQKQLDDIQSQIALLKKQTEAQESSLAITSGSLSQETQPLHIQVAQLNDQLAKCRIMNPVNGLVLAKYAEENEMITAGKPLYKIADLSTVILRAYITADQYASVHLNQEVKVVIDGYTSQKKEFSGNISWISEKAEFTPKTIQTKDERANLVYAMKVLVSNDGSLKLGMTGEIKF